MFQRMLEKIGGYLYLIFRIFVGLLFFQHGAQKLFGWFGGTTVQLFSLFGLAGIIEFFGGILIAVGLFTRIVAFFTATEMIAAYFIAHFPKGLVPIMNNGELALLYMVAFLIILVNGAKRFGIDNVLFKED